MTDESIASADDVLDFWFGELDEHGLADEAHAKMWWKKDPAFDRELGERFGALVDAVAAGEREEWLESARGSLAYVIVLDQFCRNIHRGTPRMYHQDDRARRAAEGAIDAGLDRELRAAERTFLYMPLMHCESKDAQRRCVSLFERASEELSGPAAEKMKGYLGYAHAHHRIVERFGRFPHRNEILARASTADEEAFLKESGSSF